MDKVTLVITSLNPDEKRLNRLLDSAQGFDKIVLHIDVATKNFPKINNNFVTFVHNVNHLSIPEAYNWMIKNFVDSEWVCCFCDDDYFETIGLGQMLFAIRSNKASDCDVCTFNTVVTGYLPWRDKGSVVVEFLNRYIAPLLILKGIEVKARRIYGYGGNITEKQMLRDSYTPAGSFFRKSAWDKVGGMTGHIAHDWILWLKMIRSGFRFKYFEYIVYTYERRENSAWFRQFKDVAAGSMTKLREIVNREATV